MYRTGQRFGAAHIVDVLCGKTTDKVAQHGHDELSVFGIGSDIPAQTWRSVVRQLIIQGYARSDAERYGALVLTPDSRAVLRGETSVHFRKDPGRKAKPRARARAPAAEAISEQDVELWEALRACRQELAAEHGVPPYVIFHDRTLREMLQYRPRSDEELLAINGVGVAKLERYGQRFLDVLAAGINADGTAAGNG